MQGPSYVAAMNIGGAVVGVALYLGGAAGILWLVLRSSRNLLDRKQAALTAGLQSAGASSRGTTEGGLYQGTDVSFELGGREVISNVRFASESWVRANLRVKTGPLPWGHLQCREGGGPLRQAARSEPRGTDRRRGVRPPMLRRLA